jgi:hypothetical protein
MATTDKYPSWWSEEDRREAEHVRAMMEADEREREEFQATLPPVVDREAARKDAVATGVLIRISKDGVLLAEACLLNNGCWEVHPEPVETGPWFYAASADDAVTRLVRCEERCGGGKT